MWVHADGLWLTGHRSQDGVRPDSLTPCQIAARNGDACQPTIKRKMVGGRIRVVDDDGVPLVGLSGGVTLHYYHHNGGFRYLPQGTPLAIRHAGNSYALESAVTARAGAVPHATVACDLGFPSRDSDKCVVDRTVCDVPNGLNELGDALDDGESPFICADAVCDDTGGTVCLRTARDACADTHATAIATCSAACPTSAAAKQKCELACVDASCDLTLTTRIATSTVAVARSDEERTTWQW